MPPYPRRPCLTRSGGRPRPPVGRRTGRSLGLVSVRGRAGQDGLGGPRSLPAPGATGFQPVGSITLHLKIRACDDPSYDHGWGRDTGTAAQAVTAGGPGPSGSASPAGTRCNVGRYPTGAVAVGAA